MALRVLVVDDENDAVESAATLLRIWGHDVVTASDGRTALEIVERQRPDAVILDLSLPGGLSGWQFATRLRENRTKQDSPFIVAVSGFASEADQLQSERARIDVHLVKPVEPELLRELLERRARRLPC